MAMAGSLALRNQWAIFGSTGRYNATHWKSLKIYCSSRQFMASRITIYLTQVDLRAWLAEVENATPLYYVLVGTFPQSPRVYLAAADVPSFGVSKSGDTTRGDQYLLMKQSNELTIEPSKHGYEVYPDANPGSVILNPGGTYDEKVVIEGELAAAVGSKQSVGLYRELLKTLRLHGRLVHGAIVGADAEFRARSGARLCPRLAAGEEYDVKMD